MYPRRTQKFGTCKGDGHKSLEHGHGLSYEPHQHLKTEEVHQHLKTGLEGVRERERRVTPELKPLLVILVQITSLTAP